MYKSNIRFFNKYKENLTENGMIIIDNLEFHGYVGRSKEIKSRNLRQMVGKIEKFLKFLDENSEYEIIEREILPSKVPCPKCGKRNSYGMDFCNWCGGALTEEGQMGNIV